MNILMVEDHRLVADAMQMMLTEIAPSTQVTACYSSQHALSIIDSGKQFELVLTDLGMPGINGIGLMVGLRNRDNQVPVIIVSASDDDKVIRSAMENGASGFISKTLPAAEMIDGIRKVLRGGSFFPGRFTNLDAQQKRGELPIGGGFEKQGLKPTQKQQQVLELMAVGNSNKQISQIVGITEATVKYHSSQLFKLLGVKNRTSCVREAQIAGLIDSFDGPEPVS